MGAYLETREGGRGGGGGAAILKRPAEARGRREAPAGGDGTRWELLALVVLMMAAAALRLYRLTALSLWEDEGFSAYVAWQPLASVLVWCGLDFAPPLYYLLLHFWAPLIPGDFGLRLFSAACGVAAIPLIYLCGRSAHSGRAGLIAALLLTVNACHIHFSQEVRYYALYFALSLLAVYRTLELGKEPTRGRWITWVGAAALLLYTHSTAALYVIALSGLLWTLRPRLRDPIWRGWLAAHGALAVLFLPCAWFLMRARLGLSGHYYPPTPTPGSLVETALQMATVPFMSSAGLPLPMGWDARLLVLPFLALVVWAVASRRLWTGRSAAVGLLVFGLGAWGLFFGVSVVGHSLYVLRVLLPVIGALLLVGGIVLAAAERAGRRGLAAALLGSLLVSGGISLHLYYRYTQKQEIREAVSYILQRSQDGDAAALVQHRYRWAVGYYLRGRSYPLVPMDLYLFSSPGYDTGRLTRAQAAAELHKAASLWLIELDDPSSQELNAATEAWLGTFMRPIERQSFFGVRLARLAPK